MELGEVIRKRYSVRKYADKEVEESKLLNVLNAARLAPSARNMQEWRFIVVKNKELRKKISIAANNQEFVAQAPVVIICCSVICDYIMRCGQKASPIDLAIAIDHMTLQAVNEGLGTCWIGSFYPEQVRQIAGIPENVEVVQMLTLGYPVQQSIIEKNRLNLEEIYSEEFWSDKLFPKQKS